MSWFNFIRNFIITVIIANGVQPAFPESRSGNHVWKAGVDQCSIVWFIHIPKTAGTTIGRVLKESPANSTKALFFDLHRKEDPHRNNYVEHGKYHNWSEPDLLAVVARHEGRKIVVTAETPLADLRRRKYPWFEETCFFSILRDPYEWTLSAENHMRTSSGYKGGISGNYGYFDHRNIQSYMTGYGLGSHGAVFMCVGSVENFNDIYDALFPQLADNLTLPHLNARPHPVNITKAVKDVVSAKYPLDLELWGVVARQGLVCW